MDIRVGPGTALLLIGLLAALSGVPASAVGERSVPSQTAGAGTRFEPLLNVAVTWLSANFDLPATYEHPKVELMPAVKLSFMRYGMVSLESRRDVVAVYHDPKRTIFLSSTWTGRTPAEMSVLIHELVHHLQNLGGHRYFCAEEREKLAYEAQEKWLGLFGQSLESEFGIDKLTLKVSTACM